MSNVQLGYVEALSLEAGSWLGCNTQLGLRSGKKQKYFLGHLPFGFLVFGSFPNTSNSPVPSVLRCYMLRFSCCFTWCSCPGSLRCCRYAGRGCGGWGGASHFRDRGPRHPSPSPANREKNTRQGWIAAIVLLHSLCARRWVGRDAISCALWVAFTDIHVTPG
jgi:hypothetical protein